MQARHNLSVECSSEYSKQPGQGLEKVIATLIGRLLAVEILQQVFDQFIRLSDFAVLFIDDGLQCLVMCGLRARVLARSS